MSAHLQLLGRKVRYCKVYAHTVTAIAAGGPRMELPAECVCSSNLIAHSAQQVLTCNGGNVSFKSSAPCRRSRMEHLADYLCTSNLNADGAQQVLAAADMM